MNLKKTAFTKAIISFQSGFEQNALHEIQEILSNPYLKKNRRPLVVAKKNTIYISQIHIDNLIEILYRNKGLVDIKLVILEANIHSKEELIKICDTLDWSQYINPLNGLSVKVNSVASQLFHEGAIKKIVMESKLNSCEKSQKNGPTLNQIFVNLNSNKLTISISLSGFELFKRNYKKTLEASAPLREDIASYCLQNAALYAKNNLIPLNNQHLFVPFGGSGTFIFEYYCIVNNIPYYFLNSNFNFVNTSIYKEKTVQFIEKKCNQEVNISNKNSQFIYYSDLHEKCTQVFKDNAESFFKKINTQYPEIKNQTPKLIADTLNFLEMDFKSLFHECQKKDVILMPLNPPYGLRQHSASNNLSFYEKIVSKLNELKKIMKEKELYLIGFILCPSEEIWSKVIKTLKYESLETKNFMQGGLHIRAIYFNI